MYKYRIDVLKELKEAGYNQTRIRKENILPQATVTNIRNGEMIGLKSLDTICTILKKQPNYIIEHVPDKDSLL